MKSINVEMLMGHNIGVSGHYYRPAESDMLEDYMTHAVDALTISSEYRLKKRNEELETERDQDITLLKNEITALKQFVYPGPQPRDKEMRKTYYKALKDYYKDVKGIDVDVPKHLLPDYSSD